MGIEVETLVPKDIMTKNSIGVGGYHRGARLNNYWDVQSDSSIALIKRGRTYQGIYTAGKYQPVKDDFVAAEFVSAMLSNRIMVELALDELFEKLDIDTGPDDVPLDNKMVFNLSTGCHLHFSIMDDKYIDFSRLLQHGNSYTGIDRFKFPAKKVYARIRPIGNESGLNYQNRWETPIYSNSRHTNFADKIGIEYDEVDRFVSVVEERDATVEDLIELPSITHELLRKILWETYREIRKYDFEQARMFYKYLHRRDYSRPILPFKVAERTGEASGSIDTPEKWLSFKLSGRSQEWYWSKGIEWRGFNLVGCKTRNDIKERILRAYRVAERNLLYSAGGHVGVYYAPEIDFDDVEEIVNSNEVIDLGPTKVKRPRRTSKRNIPIPTPESLEENVNYSIRLRPEEKSFIKQEITFRWRFDDYYKKTNDMFNQKLEDFLRSGTPTERSIVASTIHDTEHDIKRYEDVPDFAQKYRNVLIDEFHHNADYIMYNLKMEDEDEELILPYHGTDDSLDGESFVSDQNSISYTRNVVSAPKRFVSGIGFFQHSIGSIANYYGINSSVLFKALYVNGYRDIKYESENSNLRNWELVRNPYGDVVELTYEGRSLVMWYKTEKSEGKLKSLSFCLSEEWANPNLIEDSYLELRQTRSWKDKYKNTMIPEESDKVYRALARAGVKSVYTLDGGERATSAPIDQRRWNRIEIARYVNYIARREGFYQPIFDEEEMEHARWSQIVASQRMDYKQFVDHIDDYQIQLRRIEDKYKVSWYKAGTQTGSAWMMPKSFNEGIIMLPDIVVEDRFFANKFVNRIGLVAEEFEEVTTEAQTTVKYRRVLGDSKCPIYLDTDQNINAFRPGDWDGERKEPFTDYEPYKERSSDRVGVREIAAITAYPAYEFAGGQCALKPDVPMSVSVRIEDMLLIAIIRRPAEKLYYEYDFSELASCIKDEIDKAIGNDVKFTSTRRIEDYYWRGAFIMHLDTSNLNPNKISTYKHTLQDELPYRPVVPKVLTIDDLVNGIQTLF